MNEQLFECQSGHYALNRIPDNQKVSLRAWDAADEILLNWIFENKEQALNAISESKQSILLVNDAFGALTLGLNEYKSQVWSDSYVSKIAIEKNHQANHLKNNSVFIGSTENLQTAYPVVLIKVPKTLALLEDQLCKLKPHLLPNSKVIAAGMSKHIHTSTLKLFEKIIGNTHTSRAKKKARLIFSENNPEVIAQSSFPNSIEEKAFQLVLKNHANVFSQHKLDIGTRFFINHIDKTPDAHSILDLGCGNGALGIMAQRKNPKAKIFFVDESYAAVSSAQENYKNNIELKEDSVKPDFILSHCLDQFEGGSLDIILCNPPFHQAHSIGDQIAWRMFKQSFDCLKKQGELWVIGNRHLGYHLKMKKIFGNCKTISANKKFVILASVKH